MKNELILDNWFYKIFKINEKEIFINKVKNNLSISSLREELKPFRNPGSLQSNFVETKKFNPYFEDNIKKITHLEKFCLLLITDFSLKDPNDDYFLWFSYIDTMGQIFLNGVEIKNTVSAFTHYRIHLPNDLLKPINTLVIIISPPMSFVNKEIDMEGVEYKDRVYVRRPAYNYGWDFAPRSLLVGIGESKIFKEGNISFSDLFILTKSISGDLAKLSVSVTLNSDIEGRIELELKIIDLYSYKPVFSENFSLILDLGLNELNKSIDLKNYQLWWPNGLGNQQIYQLIISEKVTNSSIETRFGIRTVKLILKEEEENKFIFEINGKRIFAKGANWVPTDSLTNYGTEEKYRKLLTLAKEANFNMIRIWGGGVVENDIFYDICDELGLLIWHDFQFACSIYPEHKQFLSIVEVEITSIVTRLRNHPSIILWCGNNENEWIDFQHFTSNFRENNRIGEKLHQIKERVCSQLDHSRPYWRTSPWSPSAEISYDVDPNSMDEGNYHDWCVWHGVGQPNFEPPEYEEYRNNKAKFITEFGIQSFPSKHTINRIFSKKTQSKPNEIWNFHNCDVHKIKVNMKKMGNPKNIDEWILFTQAAQAFGMKYAIETWRARKFDTGGVLVWQFNEPWPTICWSLIDYYFIPKIAYWTLKRSFKLVLIVKVPDENNLIIINDLFKTIKGTLRIRKFKFNSEIIHEEDYKLSVKSNSKKEISLGSLNINFDEFLWAEFRNNDIITENIVLPCDPVDIDFPDPTIQMKLDNQSLTLISKEFAFLVHLPDELEPTDNYFHLIPNIPREIKLKHPLDNQKLRVSIWNKPLKEIRLI
ncbi:MAG: glycoside hydrolase family 2 protein [Promethearchaeota archaeon]